MQQIFPKTIIENSREVHHARHNKKSQRIYLVIINMLLFGLVVLPFIRITVNRTAQGFIVSNREHIQLVCPYSGRVVSHNLGYNAYVKKGDTLLVLRSDALDDKKNRLEIETETLLY